MKIEKSTFFCFIPQLLMVVLIIGSSIGFSSCFKFYLDYPPDENDSIPLILNPFLDVEPKFGDPFSVTQGESFDFKIRAYSNSNTDFDLKELRFSVQSFETVGSFDTIWYPDTTQLKSFIIEFNYIVPIGLEDKDQLKLEIELIDVGGNKTIQSKTMTVVDLSQLNCFNNVILGAQKSIEYGSFYISANVVLNTNEALKIGQSSVDFIYCYHPYYKASFISPDNDEIFGSGKNSITGLLVEDWDVKNTTKFRRLYNFSIKDWDLLNGERLEDKYDNEHEKELKLASNLVDTTFGYKPTFIAFKTSKSKYGILKANYINAYDSSGSISFDVKIQK